MQGPRILILDDDDHYALLFSAYLKLSGVEGGAVEHAASTDGAVERLHSFTPDVVFLDNRIPPHADFRPGLKALRDDRQTIDPKSRALQGAGRQAASVMDQDRAHSHMHRRVFRPWLE